MRATFCCFLIFLFLLNLGGVSSRNLAPNDGFAVNNQGTVHNQQSLQITQSRTNKGMKQKNIKRMEEAELAEYEEMNKIGSRPPRCEHKCYGCMPCEAIQVPTTSSRVGVQYTNYEPEGWKCKCGPTLYTP